MDQIIIIKIVIKVMVTMVIITIIAIIIITQKRVPSITQMEEETKDIPIIIILQELNLQLLPMTLLLSVPTILQIINLLIERALVVAIIIITIIQLNNQGNPLAFQVFSNLIPHKHREGIKNHNILMGITHKALMLIKKIADNHLEEGHQMAQANKMAFKASANITMVINQCQEWMFTKI